MASEIASDDKVPMEAISLPGFAGLTLRCASFLQRRPAVASEDNRASGTDALAVLRDGSCGLEGALLLGVFSGHGAAASSAAAFVRNGFGAALGWIFWVGLAAGTAQLIWQVAAVDLDAPKDCLAKFKSNRLLGWLLLAGIIGGHLS